MTGNLNTFYVLLTGKYLDFLDKAEVQFCLTQCNNRLEFFLKEALLKKSKLAYPIFYSLITNYYDNFAKKILQDFIIHSIIDNDYDSLSFLIIDEEFISLFSEDEIYNFLMKSIFADILNCDKYSNLFCDLLTSYKGSFKESFLIRILQIVTYPYSIKKVREILLEELLFRKNYG